MESELDPELADRIDELSEQGDELMENEDFNGAYELYVQALELLPEPIHENMEATWLFVSLGDSYFFPGDFEQAQQAYREAVQCPEGLGNPYVHLRLGQCAFEMKNLDRAADELTRAYMGEGDQIFEDEDPKYFEFLKSRIQM